MGEEHILKGHECKVMQFGLCGANQKPCGRFLIKGMTSSEWYFRKIWWGARFKVN